MILERFLLKLFRPRKLARRDIQGVYVTIASQNRRIVRGSMISEWTLIPEGDLRRLLVLMEKRGFIERDPGPFDAPWTPDVYRAWWCPGAHWSELVETYGALL